MRVRPLCIFSIQRKPSQMMSFVWVLIDLFWAWIGLFWAWIGLFWAWIDLFWASIGLFWVWIGLFCAWEWYRIIPVALEFRYAKNRSLWIYILFFWHPCLKTHSRGARVQVGQKKQFSSVGLFCGSLFFWHVSFFFFLTPVSGDTFWWCSARIQVH